MKSGSDRRCRPVDTCYVYGYEVIAFFPASKVDVKDAAHRGCGFLDNGKKSNNLAGVSGCFSLIQHWAAVLIKIWTKHVVPIVIIFRVNWKIYSWRCQHVSNIIAYNVFPFGHVYINLSIFLFWILYPNSFRIFVEFTVLMFIFVYGFPPTQGLQTMQKILLFQSVHKNTRHRRRRSQKPTGNCCSRGGASSQSTPNQLNRSRAAAEGPQTTHALTQWLDPKTTIIIPPFIHMHSPGMPQPLARRPFSTQMPRWIYISPNSHASYA